ncbi:cuticular collagen family protein [Myroides odoratus]|uniref:cuticular collagen family protein n=1 Tax=Myroides odoratus TaxID=256 RepID=UPI001E3B915D|nr:cuticular collagen family protein [Myroides odoratus]
MNALLKFDREEKQLREQLAKLPRTKWNALFPIPFFVLCAFLIPGIPSKGGRSSMAETMGYWEAFTAMAIVFSLVLPFMIYSHIQKVNEEMLDIERKLIRLKYKRKELETSQSSSL